MTPQKQTTLFAKFSYFVIFSAMLTIIYFWYLLFFPITIVTEKSPLKVLNPNKQVGYGEALIYEDDYCKYRQLPAITTVLLHNTITVGLPNKTGNIPVGCHKHISYDIMPDTPVVKGKAYLSFTRAYQINQFRTVYAYAETEQFEIVDKTEKPKLETEK